MIEITQTELNVLLSIVGVLLGYVLGYGFAVWQARKKP